MSIKRANVLESLLIFGGAGFTGVSSVVSGIVMYRIFVPSGPPSVVVFFVVGVITQLFIASMLLGLGGRIPGFKLPSLRVILADVWHLDFTAHLYAMGSAITGGIAVLLIALPAYGKFGTLMAAVLYVVVPALANGVVDFVWNVPKKSKPLFGVFLLLSIVSLFVMTSGIVLDPSSFPQFLSGLMRNTDLLLGMVVSFGIFIMLSDQTLARGISYVKISRNSQSPDLCFAYIRIFWLAVLGSLLGLSEAIGHEGLTIFGSILGDALRFRLPEMLLFVGGVQLAGVIINFAKASLLHSFHKTPSEIAIAFGVSSIVAFGFTTLIIQLTTGYLKETAVDMGLLPQKIIAAIAIVLLVYLFARVKKGISQSQ